MAFVKKRIRVFLYLVIAGLLGFGIWRYYRGTAENWVRFYLPDILYVVFWSLIFYFVWPSRANIVRIPVIVFIATCILEFLQLCKPAFLQQLRATLIGAAILGTDFIWLQFLFYALGLAASILLLAKIGERP
jgi:hypothetical protein